MLFLELFLSALTLLSIWAITNHRHSWGVPLALFLQFGWVAFWFYLKTYGFILIDAGMILVYGQYMYQQWIVEKT
jgi:hypothetical protein